MDRETQRSAVALCELWLQKGVDLETAEEHALLKEQLSDQAAYQQRLSVRREHEAKSAHNSELKEIMDLEAAGRSGDRTELRKIACRSIFAQLVAGLPS